jgi:hypothetical protein
MRHGEDPRFLVRTADDLEAHWKPVRVQAAGDRRDRKPDMLSTKVGASQSM